MNKADWQQLKMELHDKLIFMKIDNDLTDNELRKLLFQSAYLFKNKRTEKCEHKWVDMEDGSLDQFCVKCSLKQMQAVMKPIGAELSAALSVPLTASVMRETMEVPFYNGSEHTRMTVYKDDLINQMYEELRVPGALLNSARR